MGFYNVRHKGDKMKVFISWSGHKSFEVAKVLKEWIPCIIQDIEPYFSSEDIDKGSRWSTDIAKELEEASFGILCVTKDNLDSQWLNFEAGALSKAIDKAKVCPFLFDLKPSEIAKSPILQFQMTNVDRDDIFKLFKSMNSCLGDDGLEETRLEKMFNAFWPRMDEAFKAIESSDNSEHYSEDEKRSSNEAMFEEMLELLRTQQILLKSPDKLFPQEYIQMILRIPQNDVDRQIRQRVGEGLLREVYFCEKRFRTYLEDCIETEESKGGEVSLNHLQQIKDLYLQYREIETEIKKRLGLTEFRVKRRFFSE